MRNVFIQTPVGKSVGNFLINDWFGRAQPTIGSASPGQVGFTRKQTDQVGKEHSSAASVAFIVLTSLRDRV